MNFLAHFHLAWPDDGLVVGGLEGDYLKGPLRGTLPTHIEAGVRLHRAIDAYTDSHPIIQELRREFPEQLRRYAGILIDLSFDHYLSQHWARFSALSLQRFNSIYYIAPSPCSNKALYPVLLTLDFVARPQLSTLCRSHTCTTTCTHFLLFRLAKVKTGNAFPLLWRSEAWGTFLCRSFQVSGRRGQSMAIRGSSERSG